MATVRTALAAVTDSGDSPKDVVWAEHADSLKCTRRLEDQPQIDERKTGLKALNVRLGAGYCCPGSLSHCHSAILPCTHPWLHVCSPEVSAGIPEMGTKGASWMCSTQSLLLCISVLNTKQIMHNVLLLSHNKFQAKQLTDPLPPRTTHFLEQVRTIMSNHMVQESSHWRLRKAKSGINGPKESDLALPPDFIYIVWLNTWALNVERLKDRRWYNSSVSLVKWYYLSSFVFPYLWNRTILPPSFTGLYQKIKAWSGHGNKYL